MREDIGLAEADTHSIIRLCEIWAYRVTKERDALEAMKPLMDTQQREADCYARLTGFPDRLRTPGEATEFRDRLAILEERLAAHVDETVQEPEQRAEQAELVHSEIQKLERRSAVVGIRRSLAIVWAFIMTFVSDASKVATLLEHVERLSKFLPP